MASPPPKRQRCSTITLSDEDEEADEPRLPLRTSSPNHPIIQDATALLKSPPNSKSSKPKNVRKKVSPKSSPEKVKKPTRTKREPEKIKSLHTFFNRATEAQRWERKSITPDRDVGDGENGDVIEDDDALDDNLFVLTDQDQQNEVLNRRKLPISGNHANLSSTQRFPPSSVPKFVKPTPTVKRTFPPEPAFATQAQEPDHRPWADRYAPSNLEELAVNKKKVADVQRWLSDVLSGRDRRVCSVLLLSRSVPLTFSIEAACFKGSRRQRKEHNTVHSCQSSQLFRCFMEQSNGQRNRSQSFHSVTIRRLSQ